MTGCGHKAVFATHVKFVDPVNGEEYYEELGLCEDHLKEEMSTPCPIRHQWYEGQRCGLVCGKMNCPGYSAGDWIRDRLLGVGATERRRPTPGGCRVKRITTHS